MNEMRSKIEPRLFDKTIKLMKFLNKNQLKVEYNDSKYKEIPLEDYMKDIHVNHIGSLEIYGIEMERQKNKYIHEYKIEREDSKITYTEKTDDQSKDVAKFESKTKKMQKEMAEMIEKPKEESKLKCKILLPKFYF